MLMLHACRVDRICKQAYTTVLDADTVAYKRSRKGLGVGKSTEVMSTPADLPPQGTHYAVHSNPTPLHYNMALPRPST